MTRLDRLAGYARGSHQIGYGYDLAGHLTSRTLDGQTEALTYDDDGRLATVSAAGLTTTYDYDAAGNLATSTLPAANGYVESRTYDRSGRLTEVVNQKGPNVLSRATYTLDPVGNRLSTQTTTETATYTYDAVNQLTQVCYTVACTGPGDNFRTYTYDPAGNRLTEVRDTGTTTSTYDAADQLTGTTGPGGPVSYTYDLDGRTLTVGSTDGTRMYTWAQPDRLATTARMAQRPPTPTTATACGSRHRPERRPRRRRTSSGTPTRAVCPSSWPSATVTAPSCGTTSTGSQRSR
jgi:YD repeat-containing protein